MTRLTDDDKHWGPITYGHTSNTGMKAVAVENCGDDDDYYGTCLTFYWNRFCMRIRLPNFIKPYAEERGFTTTDGAGNQKTSTYTQVDPREYGISYMDGHLSLRYGRQSGDSRTTKQRGWFIPWTQWRMVRHSLYDAGGKLHFETRGRKHPFDGHHKARDTCSKRVFAFRDYDGEEIEAVTHIEERQWRFGEKWCSWLSLFRKPKVVRSLDIAFSDEVGPRKGSWKGGTVGHGIDMLEGEDHESAFRRYCAKGYRSSTNKTYDLTYIKELSDDRS